MIQPTIRDSQPHDRIAIAEFQLALALETENLRLDRRVCEAGVDAVFADPSRGRYIVAELNARVIASLMITYEWSDWRNGTIWWLQSVYVIPEFRGRGVFQAVFSHVRTIAERDPTVKGMRLYVDRRNTRAQSVYRRLAMDGDHYQMFEWMK